MRKLVLLALAACLAALVVPQLADAGKKKKKGAAASASRCPAACEHRKECKVAGSADVAACTSACESVASLYTAEGLDGYIAADCAAVKSVEPGFRGAVACQQACAHRAECVPAADVDRCLNACVTLEVSERDARAYAGASCDQVEQFEPTFAAAQACVYGCRKVLTCGVAGDAAGCFSLCAQGIQNGTFKIADVEALEKKPCKWVKQNISLEPQGGGGGGGGSAGGGGDTGIYRTQGKSCVGGDNTCQGVNICCGRSGPADNGERGVCFSAPICNI